MPPRLSVATKMARGTYRPGREIPPTVTVLAGRPPPPPRGLPARERAIWRQLAEAVGPEGTGVYSPAFFWSFRLTVKTLFLVDAAGPGDPPTATARLVQAASGMLARLGLDPGSVGRVSPAPKKKEPSAMDEFAVERDWNTYPGKNRP